MAANIRIHVDFAHDASRIFASIHDAVVDGLQCRFDDAQDEDWKIIPLLPKEDTPAKIVERLTKGHARRLLGEVHADWSVWLPASVELLEAKNATGVLAVQLGEQSGIFPDRSVVTFRNVGVSWEFPSEFEGVWMDMLEGVDMSIDFRRGICFWLKWPS